MPAKRTVALALAALLGLSAVAAAGAHGDHHAMPPYAQDHADARDDHAQAQDNGSAAADDAGPPEEAHFGLCTARSHLPGDGQASAALPFQALSDALCEDVSHPGQGHADDAKPDHAGDDAGEDEAEDDAARDGDDGRPDHAGPPR